MHESHGLYQTNSKTVKQHIGNSVRAN